MLQVAMISELDLVIEQSYSMISATSKAVALISSWWYILSQ